ncbi:BtrH N-terminal domain-containing protein [Cohnella xylanilytica]|uniref:BtrH N-terminal domain-containing protein n=1 Tax=Cohnella xylanilytica TaxID=557555 RepID=UPI001BB31AFB|nr:BtrH N-terminal domain-containing protein [Cohnella xylanilytica]
MMRTLDLEPVKSAGGDCFDDVIVTLDGWFRRGYKLMYAEALKFEFAPPDSAPTLGARMRTGLDGSLRLLERFHGYSIRVIRNPDPEEGLSLIREQLSRGHPVGLNLDTYYSPWDPNYQFAHYFTHVMLVTGLDPVTEDLTVVDPFFVKKNMTILREHYAAGLLGFMTVEPADGDMPEPGEVIPRLAHYLREHQVSSLDGFREFAEAIRSVRFADEAEGHPNFMSSPMYMRLNSLVTARFNYAGMLEYAAERFSLPGLAACADDLRQLGNRWSTVRAVTAKLSFMPPERLDETMRRSLSDKIAGAGEAEERAVLRILGVLEGVLEHEPDRERVWGFDSPGSVRVPVDPAAGAGEEKRRIVHVDIRDFCDVRGIDNGLGTADADSDGHCYCAEDLPPDGVLRVGDVSFAFPAADGGACDNISCYRQEIPLPPDRYRGLAVLACSQFGSSADSFVVEYEDGGREEVRLAFADWWSRTPCEREKIAWTANLIRNKKGKLENLVHLFADEAPLVRNGSKATRLILPGMPNLHVYGVSLWT